MVAPPFKISSSRELMNAHLASSSMHTPAFRPTMQRSRRLMQASRSRSRDRFRPVLPIFLHNQPLFQHAKRHAKTSPAPKLFNEIKG
jgi:hypothetical protein